MRDCGELLGAAAIGSLVGAAAYHLLRPDDGASMAPLATPAPPVCPAPTPAAPPTLPPNSVAFVTGVAPGTMGYGIAVELAALGCSIAAVEHPARFALAQECCAELRAKFGVTAVALAADATDPEQVERAFVDAAVALGAEPNLVVSTVGGGGVGPDGTPHNQGTDDDGSPLANMAHQEAWETTMRIIAVTQFSQHFCCKAGARHILKGGRGGSIVLIGSIMATYSAAGCSTYTSSKCAVRKLSEVMARELGPFGVRVNCVQPGHMATAVEAVRIAADPGCDTSRRIPVGRMGTAADVGKTVAFLCSDAASYITGSTVNVDGGWGVVLDLPLAS